MSGLVTFEWIIGLLLGAVALSALARRTGIPYPTYLALGGMALAFVPSGPQWTLEPDLALALFVAPVLLDAAFDTSLRDLRDNWLQVATLVIVAVAVTTVATAFVARLLVPEMPWAAAIAFGAIVAPPDAAAAAAVLRQVGLPHRLLKILEGESLLNDASALLIYRIAVAAAVTEHLSWSDFGLTVGLGLAGSVVAGLVFAWLSSLAMRAISDVPSSIIVQFAGTFMVWIAAEAMHLSPILTIVVYAVAIARGSAKRMSARMRVPSFAVWETVVFVLNVMAFVMIGMQLRPIWERLDSGAHGSASLVAAAVLATVIATRIVWVMAFNTAARWRIRRTGFHPPRPMARPTLQGGIVIAWCGMRGIVTLAAAFALPEGFPFRDLILLTAFAVVLGTLVIQGATLRPLIALLKMRDDDNPIETEVGRARTAAYEAALKAIDGDRSDEAELLRAEYRTQLRRASGDPDGAAPAELPADPLRRRAISAARDAVMALRDSEAIGDDAFHLLEEEFDFAELNARA